MSVPLILRNFFTGETSGGSFTLTNLTQYPNTIFVSGGTGNVTFNSASDLPYTVPTGYVASVTVTTPGVYTFDYCVDSCPSVVCSTVDITIIDKPIIGTTPTIYRCGVNGVYNNINVCYEGSITNNSDGLPYSGTLSSFTWSKGAWSATGSCVTIPTSVTAGAITLTATTTGGTCVSTNTVNLVDVNIYAGNSTTKNYCLDKHQVEIYKNTPTGSNTNIEVDLNTVFAGTGEIIPTSAITTWSFVSGPTIVVMTTNTKADIGNAPTGTYIFKRKVTYGSCVSETTYTMVLKYCTRGDQVITNRVNCKLNVTLNMATTLASTINPLYNPITTGGCFYYLGLIGGVLDIEINGTLFTNFPVLGCIPYNANVKIVSVGTYDFEYTSTSNLSGCTSCTPVDDLTLCGCDYFSTFNGVGTFVIDTTGSIPNAGATKIHNLGCGSRQVSLFSKFNQLNGGNITAGGVWTYQGLAAPITFLVNGTSMTFNIGDTIPGSDPLVDLTGLPNPSNYIFKYTVTNACGTANKNLIVNITCNDCNKTIDTTYTKTDCVNTYSVLHPVTLAVNQVRVGINAGEVFVKADWIQRITTCEGINTDTPSFYSTYAALEYRQNATAPTNGTHMKSLKLWSSTTGYVTLNLDPATTTYLTGCAGTVLAADLYINLLNLSTYRIAIDKLMRNAICAAFGGAVVGTNYNYAVNVSSAGLSVRFKAGHNPPGQWICLNDASGNFVYNKNGVDTTVTFVNKDATGPTVRSQYTDGEALFCENFNVYIQNVTNPAKGIDVTASSMTNIVLKSTVDIVAHDTADPLYKPTTTCKKWNFSTTISPACSGTPTYSYKVGGSSIPETTAMFIKKPYPDNECNPFNSGLSQSLETTVVCDGCTYVKTPITFC
jgi:hypothetical protein